MFDLSDHALLQISTWAVVATLLFMVWEKYGPTLRIGSITLAMPRSHGVVGTLWQNKTIIVALAGLALVTWLHLGHEDLPAIVADRIEYHFDRNDQNLVFVSRQSHAVSIEDLKHNGKTDQYVAVFTFILGNGPFDVACYAKGGAGKNGTIGGDYVRCDLLKEGANQIEVLIDLSSLSSETRTGDLSIYFYKRGSQS